MLVLPSAVLLGAIAIFATPIESSDATQPLSTNFSCTSDQTECLFGCCPYADAVCCVDGFECCQSGQTCIPIIGICLGIVGSKKKNPVLVSSKTAAVNIAVSCPDFTTTCAPDKCCLYPQATCCADGEHCCPHGYSCDDISRSCYRSSDNNYLTFDLPATTEIRSLEPLKTARNKRYKSCPGGTKLCPSHMSCCLDDKNYWSCCPSLNSLLYGKGINDDDFHCCSTSFGYICCTNVVFPLCTPWGCI